MTTIYSIPNLAQSTRNYVCDSQATIDSAPADLQALCTVGTEADANTVLANNQQAWLTAQSDLFTCNLETAVEGGVVWTVVDLATEQPNTDKSYFVLDPTTGTYTGPNNLATARTVLAQTHETYLAFTNMATYTTLTEWPTPPSNPA